MPKEFPNFSRDVERLVSTGRVKSAEEAEERLAPQKRLAEERNAALKRVNELREQAAPSENEVRAELKRRLEILERAYNRRKERLIKHYNEMLNAGVSPVHEEFRHESEKLSQIERDFKRERGLFEQFDAEERLVALHQYAEAAKSFDPSALKAAKRKIEDTLDEQGVYDRNRQCLYGVLSAWAHGYIKLIDGYYKTDETGRSLPIAVSLEAYQGKISEDGYLTEKFTELLAEGSCVQGIRTLDNRIFCVECPPDLREDADMHEFVRRLRRGW